MATRTPDDIVETLAAGAMAPMAAGLSRQDLDAIALYLTGKARGADNAAQADPDASVRCSSTAPPSLAGPRWNGWSPTADNARFQPDPQLTASELRRLRVRWAFAFTGGVAGQPAVVGGRVYLGAGSGKVYALDAKTGCIHWRAEVRGGVRTSIIVAPLEKAPAGRGRLAVFVGDRTAGIHALDAASGREIWSTKVEDHPFATITGSPALHEGRLYVPVSSSEEGSPYVRGWRCCTFRGSVAALDAATGKILWKTFTIAEAPKPYRTDRDGGQLFGPAGGAVWSAPTIDPKRRVLYVATGDSYTDAPNTGSDAVIAMDLASGEIRWSRQVTADDNYLVGCTGAATQPPACPRIVGPDYDFGASPILGARPGGKAILLAGQKSGVVTALDPDQEGAIVWQRKLGLGSGLGGVEWGMALDGDLLYVPIADPYAPKGEGKAGMYAVRIGDGQLVWAAPAPDPDCAKAPRGSLLNICAGGLSSAPTATADMVLEGSLDGVLRAYAKRNGAVVWSLDVGQTRFQPINAPAPIRGDTMNGAGVTLAGGAMYQVSGYQSANAKAVNLLLAFSVDGR